jgi:carboxymethylenebutenolidase
MSDIGTEKVTLSVSDGTSMDAFVARPAQKGPGLLVLQEAFGVNAHIRDVAQRFAREGYLAIAPELFHRTAPGFESGYGDFEKVKPHYMAMTLPGLEADCRAAHDWLSSQGVKAAGAIGFCLGGRAAYVANSILPLKAAVSFYGAGIAPDLLGRAKDQSGPIVLFWGGLDKHISPEVRRAVADALRAAGKSFVEVDFSAADHGFFNDARSSYEPASAEQAFALAKAFFKKNLEP